MEHHKAKTTFENIVIFLNFKGLKSKHGRGEGGKASLRECRGHLKGMSRGRGIL